MKYSRRFSLGALLCLLFAVVPATFAQTGITFSGEGGIAQNSFGNGSTDQKVIYGATLSAIIGGESSKKFGFHLPVYGEFKAAKMPGDSYTDLIAGADAAFRWRNLSLGPGANYGYVVRGEVEDRACLGKPVRLDSSCLVNRGGGSGNNGLRDIGSLNLMGFGGFAKYSFGPQGRAFVQGRYIYYDKSLGRLMNRSDWSSLSTVDLSAFNLPAIPDIADYPQFNGGRDIRISGGYVFHGGKFLRAQYVDRQFNFTPTLANVTGVFDQRSRMFTVGGGVIF